ncbi:hypothetical protein [Allorhodopirellula heiligendammensis]|nr:hypothetical protein [Allorhodopirellula heiligendammensis]
MSTDSQDSGSSSTAPSDRSTRRVPAAGLERHLFDRIRTWTDVFPWLRLVRVCRIAGGPVWISHTLIVSLIWLLGFAWLADSPVDMMGSYGGLSLLGLPLASATMPSDAWAVVPGINLGSWIGVSPDWKTVVWTISMWLPTMMALARVGAILTAGRDLPSYLSTFRAVGRRLLGAAVIVLLPAVVAACLCLVAWCATWVAVAIGGDSIAMTWATWLSQLIVLPATLIAGLLILGGKLAVPLGLTATMIEPDADPIDALSRGYEYTLRRLPQFTLLAIIAGTISAVVVLAWVGVSMAARGLAVSLEPANPPLLLCLALLPSVIAVMMLWAMVGGIYLLLRQSAGGQEVEDLAIDPGHWKSPAMPSVQQVNQTAG